MKSLPTSTTNQRHRINFTYLQEHIMHTELKYFCLAIDMTPKLVQTKHITNYKTQSETETERELMTHFNEISITDNYKPI